MTANFKRRKRWIIKLGGSLGGTKTIDMLANTIDKLSLEFSLVILPGGGEYADFIREKSKSIKATEKTTHAQAVLATAQYGHYLASIIRQSVIAHSNADVNKALQQNKTPVFIPYPLALDCNKVPASWDATSDTISAVVCQELRFGGLILLKSVDGIMIDGKLAPTVTRNEATRSGVVDPLFCRRLGEGWDVCIINGRHPERLEDIVTTGSAIMTRIVT